MGAACSRDSAGHCGVYIPDLACFDRWAEYQSGPAGMQKSRTMKTKVACRDCETGFVKYAYDGTMSCEACGKAHRKTAQEVRK
ncbi:hypothetical protein DAMNIGENAA_25220 [Desulforhabdus amnigena]|uniref:Uncharacterized protein n=1 Tax=Desulforhabdus amnigena TaxID=40218 RepID=A0A9W6FUH5_9BACT|nr:hypothetical protein DAMNIGENAA_25220 [Desulforhabdus amnigena]